jgi:hypothetical protein
MFQWVLHVFLHGNGDTCGCRFLLGGVVMGLTVLSLGARENPRSDFAGPGNNGATASFSS